MSHTMNANVKWDDWYLTVMNRHNFVRFPVETSSKDDRVRFDKDREHWSIHLTINLSTDMGNVFRTSSLIAFDEDNMMVTTQNGSIYKLNNPINEYQLPNLRLYFKETSPIF